MKIEPSKVLKVLFVDDDSDELYLFNEALEQSGLSVSLSRAQNGNQLLELLSNEETPDIILIDINMPHKDGIEALSEIRSNTNFNNIFIIIYSIAVDKALIKKVYDIGANLYLIKPNDFEGMLTVVKKVFSIDYENFTRPVREQFVVNLNK